MAFYGDFRKPGWEGANLVQIIPPFQMYYDKHPIKSLRVSHRKCRLGVSRGAFNEVFEKCRA